jgi:hypothetical protein
MLNGDVPGICNGAEIDFSVPGEQLASVVGKLNGNSLIDYNAQFASTVNDEALPFAGTNFHVLENPLNFLTYTFFV